MFLKEDASEWAAVAEALAVRPDDLRLVRQVHGAGVAVVRRASFAPVSRPDADVMISDDPRSAIGVRVADCAPILIADRRLGVVGAAHAGWRGTVAGAARAAVEAMAREFDARPADFVAAIGPCLGVCCGEVGEEVVRAFLDAGHSPADVDRWFTTGPTPKPYLDLARANADQLRAAGVPPDSIHLAGLCTRTHADVLHSYRTDGAGAGRMLAAIKPLPPQGEP